MLGLMKVRSGPLGRRLRQLTPGERREEATQFLTMFHQENGLAPSDLSARLAEVKASLKRSGTYAHTPEELAFGARLAWRNHAKCIGRLFWKSLEVVDRRDVTDPDQIAAEIGDHLENVYAGGKIRSRITIFAPEQEDGSNCFSVSGQAIQYAGYQLPGGKVLGDSKNVELTRIAQSLGWEPPARRGMFDVLPLVLSDGSGSRKIYALPPASLREIPITHPGCERFGALGLRWYAVPLVTNMILTVGGIDYPCAPFNGFYMATEIASRNYTDERRYDLLHPAAKAWFGSDDYQSTPLWKDEVALELNRAVLHSFRQAGVMILDHHEASEQYVQFERREHASGRTPSSKWSWIVPPQASSACPVFHLPMRDLKRVPNFYYSRVTDGAGLRLDRSDELRSRIANDFDRLKRRARRWVHRHERWFG